MSTSRLTAFTPFPCSSSKTPSCSFLETSTNTSRPRSAKSPSEIPKFPEVASKTGCPVTSLPPLIASPTICTIGLTFTDPLRILDSSFPNTLNSLSEMSSPYATLAHSFSKSVRSTRGVALSTFPPPPCFSTWGTFALIDSSKLRRSSKSTRLVCFGGCNGFLFSFICDGVPMLLYNICYRRPDVPTATYKAPAVPASKITPQFVRNELLTCFESANREFARVLKQPVTDEALKQQVRQFVTSVFSQCGVSFDKPTKVGI